MSFLPLAESQPKVMAVSASCAAAADSLQPLAAGITHWQPADPGMGYGENLVSALMSGLDEIKPDLLLCPALTDADSERRALALACLEAARRKNGPDCTWPKSTWDGQALGPAGWELRKSGKLLDDLLAFGETALLDSSLQPARAKPPAEAPLVSVIVRSMDRASLARALASIALQTYRPIELVLVNAKGAAHSPWPAVKADLMLKSVASGQGLPLARSRAASSGLDAAQGDWALFLDDDDELMPDHLSRLVRSGLQHPDAPAVYADVDMGHGVEGVWQQQHRFAADFDPVRLLFENYLPIHAVLFRREVALRHASFDTDFDLFEDWDFWLQLAQVADFVRVPGVSARYVAPQVAGRSEVFEDTPAARTARERLFEKWRQRLSPGLYARALHRLQSLHRQAGQQQAQLIDLQRGHAEQGAVLQAREAELADYAPRLAAREAELASARLQHEAQQMILTAREQELANALAAIEAQGELLAHREREAREGVEYASSLRETLAHREREIVDASAQLADLRAALAASQQELSQRDLELATSRTELANSRAELATLHAEKPLQALARTLRSKNKPHAPRT